MVGDWMGGQGGRPGMASDWVSGTVESLKIRIG